MQPAEALADDLVVDPDTIASWLFVDREWIDDAIDQGLPTLGRRTDGIPLFAVGEVRAWLRRPTLADDET